MEVLLYSEIYSWTAEYFIQQVNAIEDDSLTARVNCDGGDVIYGWGIIAKFIEFQGEKAVKIDGKARSMAAFMACYTENVSALDVADIVLHRAAYPDWYESGMNDEDKTELTRINKHLEAALRAKVDVEKFESITGTTIKEMFSLDSRIDVTLTAKQAKQIGLINEIVTITPEKKQKIEARTLAIAAKFEDKIPFKKPEIVADKSSNNQNSKITKMTIEKFKTENPEVFAQAVALGVSQERDRVGAWAKFNGIDPVAVVTGIESGENITQTAMADFALKSMAGKQVEAIENEAPEVVATTKVEDTELTETQKVEAAAMALITNPSTK